MKTLPQITLCAVTSVKLPETIRALKKSMRGITYARVILLTDADVSEPGIEVIRIQKLGYDDYSRFVIFELQKYIETEFVILIQHDGYVLRPSRWRNAFLQYDYIGAPWPENMHFTKDGKNIRVGNGGFTLRSQKLLRAPSELGLPFTDNGTGYFHEDGVLCIYHRKALENYGITYAPVDIASRFSRERWCHDSVLFPFGFHNGRSVKKSIKKLFSKRV